MSHFQRMAYKRHLITKVSHKEHLNRRNSTEGSTEHWWSHNPQVERTSFQEHEIIRRVVQDPKSTLHRASMNILRMAQIPPEQCARHVPPNSRFLEALITNKRLLYKVVKTFQHVFFPPVSLFHALAFMHTSGLISSHVENEWRVQYLRYSLCILLFHVMYLWWTRESGVIFFPQHKTQTNGALFVHLYS